MGYTSDELYYLLLEEQTLVLGDIENVLKNLKLLDERSKRAGYKRIGISQTHPYDPFDHHSGELEIFGERLETDKEFNKRILRSQKTSVSQKRRRALQTKRKETKEREEYEKEEKKFNPEKEEKKK